MSTPGRGEGDVDDEQVRKIAATLERADIDVEELVERVQNLPPDMSKRAKRASTSRRGFLGTVAGATTAGALAYNAGKAEAADNEVGTLGTSSSRVDLFGDDVDANSVTTPTIIDADDGTAYDVGDEVAGAGPVYHSGPPTFAPHPSADNPVLTGSDVGANADEVADPFVVFSADDNQFHFFFEELVSDGDPTTEDIGHATSPDGLEWTYQGTVIDDSTHKAYPFVVQVQGTWYMTPDPGGGNDFDIWEADPFPSGWVVAETPITQSGAGHDLVDPTPVFWNDRWYIFFNDAGADDKRLYHADSTGTAITGRSWSEHPSSPIVANDATLARNAGRPIVHRDSIDFFSQDDTNLTVRGHRITDLTTASFTWTELSSSPVLGGTGNAWTENDMHHVDPLMPFVGGPPVVVVDGRDGSNTWSIGMYTLDTRGPATAKATIPSNQSISSGSWNRVNANTTVFDVGGDLDTAADEFVAPASGWYYLGAAAKMLVPASNTEAPFRIAMRLYDETAAAEIATSHTHAAFAEDVAVSADTIAYLPADQHVSVDVYQDSGSSKDLQSGSNNVWLEVRRVY